MTPRVQRKQREHEARRQEILSAAESLFSKHGFFKTSMADIAINAQFAMGTLYRFFKNKEDMYISLVESKVEELERLVKKHIAGESTACHKIAAFIRIKLDYADRNRDFFRIYVSEWSGFEWTVKSAFGERVWKLYMAQVDLVAELVQEGIQNGEFRDVASRDVAFALHGMLNSTMYIWILQCPPTGSLVEKAHLIQNIFLQGIAKSQRDVKAGHSAI
ncbi:MAG: TetR family transcriptional regulator [Nitrospirales bacterium]|nr:TetR family transcriptional regulator [Nitrospirales bacterium]